MNTIVFTAAKNFLHNKLQIQSQSELFKHFIKTPSLFSKEQLKKDSNQYLLYKMIFIAGVLERRNFGAIVKDYTKNSLIQLRGQMGELDVPTLVQLFLVLGNVLLYDEQIVNTLLIQLKENEREVTSKQMYSIFHSLYKIGLQDKFWEQKAYHSMINNVQNVGVQDYVQYMHIASNLYKLGQFDEQQIITLLEILIFKLGKQYKHIYQSKFSYQFAQMMFNLYPEIIDQQVGREECSISNKFSNHFNNLRRDYIICRQILCRKYTGASLDYFENENFPNIFRLREDNIIKAQSEFEKEVERALKLLQKQYLVQELMLIYDIDFLVENKYIVNCNGPLHFITTLEDEIKDKSLNSYMQLRHLQGLKNYKIIHLDFNQWNQPATKEIIAQELQKLMNIL